jgi:CheY-like chemotaxis protein
MQNLNGNEGHVILVAEDDENHVFFIQRAFERASLLNPVHFVPDGEQAIAYLAGEGKYANRDEFPLPSLLLLDLKMPNKDGFDVLEWVRQHPTLSALRIIVLTTSGATKDINRAYKLGANSFLTKPMNFTDLVQLTRWVKGYWLHFSSEPEIEREPKQKPETWSR